MSTQGMKEDSSSAFQLYSNSDMKNYPSDNYKVNQFKKKLLQQQQLIFI